LTFLMMYAIIDTDREATVSPSTLKFLREYITTTSKTMRDCKLHEKN